MAVAVLFTASCAKEDISSSIGGGEVEVTFSANLPELGTRAYGTGEQVNKLRYFVYDGNTLLSELSGEQSISVNAPATVTVALLKGMTYNIVFWADYNSLYSYDSASKSISVDYANVDANDEKRDAFYKYVASFDPATARPEDTNIVLTRPFAQLNTISTDNLADLGKSGVNLTTSTITLDTYSTLNLATGEVDGLATKTLKAANVLDGGLLSMNYLLAPAGGYTTEVALTINNNKSINFGNKFNYVPLKRNYRTNIIGKLLTSGTNFTVEIEAAFNQPDEFASRFDPANRTVTIGSAEEFLGLTALSNDWAAKFSNGLGTEYSNYAAVNGGKGTDYYYKWDWTIKLDADIDLKGVTLDAPINVKDWKLFDGQGHTIKNVNVVTANNTENNAGLFIGGKNCGFKNIVLDNVNVTGSLVGNSTAAILAADCNSAEGATGITIKNSSVWGGKYTGGVVGYGYTHTTGCTLENCVIKGGYKLGGIIGYICSSNNGMKAVDNHTLTNCTVAGTDGQYAGGKSEYVMGRVVGNFNTDGSCQNNKISNMTTVATENIGQIEAGMTVQQ